MTPLGELDADIVTGRESTADEAYTTSSDGAGNAKQKAEDVASTVKNKSGDAKQKAQDAASAAKAKADVGIPEPLLCDLPMQVQPEQ